MDISNLSKEELVLLQMSIENELLRRHIRTLRNKLDNLPKNNSGRLIGEREFDGILIKARKLPVGHVIDMVEASIIYNL